MEIKGKALRTCCFFGHRNTVETKELREKLRVIIEKLITEESVDTFLFGSKSRFNDLCHELVTKSKENHPHVKRIYVRAEYPEINDAYRAYLSKDYEETYFPKKLLKAGRAIYVERNREMLRKSDFCVICYDENRAPTTRRSGTGIALRYAVQQKKRVIMVS